MVQGRAWIGRGRVLAALALLCGAGALRASSDFNAALPDWQIASADSQRFDFDLVSRPMLAPGKDTRVNLMWLMRSLHPVADDGAAYPPAVMDYSALGHSFLTWRSLRDTYWPHADSDGYVPPPPPCTVPAGADAAFAAALLANKAVPAAERDALTTLRTHVGCKLGDPAAPITSAAGLEFLGYLRAAAAFYTADWPAAQSGFAALVRARDPWLADVAAYMPIRIALAQAVAGATDKYGDFTADKVDRAALDRADSAIAAYRARRPAGRYLASAEGLVRRVQWLRGDLSALAHSYEHLLATMPPDREDAADLAQEIDQNLLGQPGIDAVLRQAADMPLLLAVADLRAMRKAAPDGATTAPPPLTAANLAAQAPAFAQMPDLYGFLVATRAYYSGDAARVLAMIPDGPPAGPLGFSRQMLRGMALSATGSPEEEAFWARLIPAVRPLFQRPYAELGLALLWQGQGRIDRIFAAGSPITDQPIREILMQTIAPVAILRAQANDAARPAHERDVARFTLLYKSLSRGAYADFGRDLALVPADAKADAPMDFSGEGQVSVGLFTHGKWQDGWPCPPIAQTAARLASQPADRSARLCLGEFWRLNGFDNFALFQTVDPNDHRKARPATLGNAPDRFPGNPLYRGAIYAGILADPQAAPDERAYALYRAVLCFAPVGNNSCERPSGQPGVDALSDDKAVHRAWFNELKTRYPASRWAKALRYWY